MADNTLNENLDIVAQSGMEIQLLDGDLNIIAKLDDEPNDVGGLSADELKATFDKAGNIIKDYINETLIPAILEDDATEAARTQAEQERVIAESGRVTAENERVEAEAARRSAEADREDQHTGTIAKALEAAYQAEVNATGQRPFVSQTFSSVDAAGSGLNSMMLGPFASTDTKEYALQPGREYTVSVNGETENTVCMLDGIEVLGVALTWDGSFLTCVNNNSEAATVVISAVDNTLIDSPKGYKDTAVAAAQTANMHALNAKAYAEGGKYYNDDDLKVWAEVTGAKQYAERAELAAIKQPIIQDGTWWVWDAESGAYTDTGVKASGSGSDSPSSGSDVLVVTFTTGLDVYYADKTYAEIAAAIDEGRLVIGMAGNGPFDESYLPPPVCYVVSHYTSNRVEFSAQDVNEFGGPEQSIYIITSDDYVGFERRGYEDFAQGFIDEELSATSTNAVQNKVVYSALAGKQPLGSYVKTVNGAAPDENGNVVIESSGSGGTTDYTALENKPKINGVELTGDKTAEELGVGSPSDEQVASAVSAWLDEHPEATTSVADGSITNAKLAEGAVSVNKTDVFVLTEDKSSQFNLLAETEWEGNGYFNGTLWVENTSRYTSKLFAVSQSVLYAKPGVNNDRFSVLFYDADHTKLNEVDTGYMALNTTFEVDVPDGAVYARVTLRDDSYDITDPLDTTTKGVRLLENRSVKTYKLNETNETKYKELAEIARLDGYLVNYKKWAGKKILFDGNSLTIGYRQETPWVDVLCDLLGASYYNHAESGSSLVASREIDGTTYTAVEKVNSLYEEDADCVFLVGDYNYANAYAVSETEALKTAIGTVTDTVADGKTTWMAKMNEVIDAIYMKYPAAPVILMTDPPAGGDAAANLSRGKFGIMRDALRDIAYHRRVVFFDTFTSSVFRPWLEGNDVYDNYINHDGVHFGKTYAKLLGQVVCQKMTEVMVLNDV